MAGGKATPRQKMINMMYLVLTALLALNVSKEILNAFVIMDDGLTASKNSVEKKNSDQLASFKDAQATQPKFKAAYEQSVKAHALADGLVKKIEDLKILLIKECEGDETEALAGGKILLAKLGKKDDYDTPTRIMVGGEDGPVGKGDALKKDLRQFVKDLIKLANPKDSAALHKAITIDTRDIKDPEEPELDTWEAKIFHHTPMAAAIAHLSKLQGDVRNAESETVTSLFASVTKRQIAFDKFSAIVSMKDGFIFTGSSTEATIGLGAYDSSQKLKVRMTSGPQVTESMIKDGVVVMPISGGAVGEQILKGEIIVFDPETNADKAYGFETKYVVGAPMATISPIKMNVMYIGVDNPIDVSVSGVAASKVQASFPGCTFSGSGGHYVVRPTSAPGSKCLVNVNATMPDGSSKNMGKMEFRIKKVPNPTAKVLKYTGGKVPTGELKVAPGVSSILENFDFELSMPIVSYEVSGTIKGNYIGPYTCNGPAFSADAKNAIFSKLSSGSRVFIDNIKVKAPEGNRTLPSGIVLTCN